MIISASRRTDIPAFYSTWLMNRLQAGYCTVPNPFNRGQISYISLKPKDVDVIVFWTRNPAPLLSHLKVLDNMGLHYYFQYTIVNYPRELDQKGSALKQSLTIFRKLSDQIGPDKVIWRYDPIVFTKKTGMSFHIENYQKIAKELRGYTKRSVISVMDFYRKIQKRMKILEDHGLFVIPYQGSQNDRFDTLMESVSKTAKENEMEIVSCAEELDLAQYRINHGKCIDDIYIQRTFGIDVTHRKDPSQREACGCVVSRDIGIYDTCLSGCQYCYATTSFNRAKLNHTDHNPKSPSLIGWFEATPQANDLQPDMFREVFDETP